jgi:hypothetical protein
MTQTWDNIIRETTGNFIRYTPTPNEFLQTKWIRANESIPIKLIRFLHLWEGNLVAKKEDVMTAIKLAYERGKEDRPLREASEKTKREMIL